MKITKKRQVETQPLRKLARLRIYSDGFGLQWATIDENGQEVLEPLRDYLACDLAQLDSEASRQKQLAIQAEEMGHKTADFQVEFQARGEASCNQASCSPTAQGEKLTTTQPATVQHI